MTEKPKRKNSENNRQIPCLWIGIAGLLCLGAFLAAYFSIGRLIIGPPIFKESCELEVNENIDLKIESYLCDMCGHPRHYSISDDAGETWTAFYTHLNNDDPVVADCSEFQIYSLKKFYFIPTTHHLPYFIITNDGGVNWHKWRPSDVEYPTGFRCRTIEEVSFQNEINGTMQLLCGLYTILTSDGGITWEIAND
jgi:hypothetical protein